MLRLALKFIIRLVLILPVSACAFVDNQIQLEFEAPSATEGATGNGETLVLALFKDQRSDKLKIGVIKNGYGMETAKVLTKDDPAVWISNAIKSTLEAEGYSVESVPAGGTPPSNRLQLSGTVTKVYSEPKMGFWTATITGDVEALIQAQFRGQTTSKLIAGRSEETSMITTGGDLHKRVLTSALDAFIKNFMSWFHSLRG
tara:strand:- start:83 stop:685 length:603 start_codon:yes stop_codon:yes gene_type:complete